jgi:hypothetical protein
VFERPSGTPTEFELLVRLTAIAAGAGPNADPVQLAEASLAGQVATATATATSVLSGCDPEEIMSRLGTGPIDEQILDFMIRTGHRGDGFGANPGGLTLAELKAHPHGLDLGPLTPRIPDGLATPSGKIEIGHEVLVADLARLEAAIEGAPGPQLMLVGRRQVRTANSWTHNVEVLVKGKEGCTAHMHPDDAAAIGVVTGERVDLASSAGSVSVEVEVTDSVMPGVVSVPYGWGHGLAGTRQSVASRHAGVNVNVLTDSSVIDPLSGNARLNGIPVTAAKAT